MSAALSAVHWAELRPDDFVRRRDECPVVYLPLGLCEPHGHVAALGLDLLKAEYYCTQAARSLGGIVAPSQGYHIHESGFHAPWLAEVVGEQNPLMAAIPPHVMLHLFLYQLRAFANAGFKAVIAVSGHSGGSQIDLRRAAELFTARTKLPVVVKSDPEWVAERYVGDHAGRYELSQLLAIRPDLVDLSLRERRFAPDSGGRLALGDDAAEARAELGSEINAAIVAAIVAEAQQLVQHGADFCLSKPLAYEPIETMWRELQASSPQWESLRPRVGDPTVPANSRWHPYLKPTALFTA